MSGSVDRVRQAAAAVGLEISIIRMPASTRTALEAATACGCEIGQIVKSLVFREAVGGELVLILVAGDRQVDVDRAGQAVGGRLERVDAKTVREVTGFAIGGVAPIGHERPIRVFMDPSLCRYPIVWAAAGAPDAVFSVAPDALRQASGAQMLPADATAVDGQVTAIRAT